MTVIILPTKGRCPKINGLCGRGLSCTSASGWPILQSYTKALLYISSRWTKGSADPRLLPKESHDAGYKPLMPYLRKAVRLTN